MTVGSVREWIVILIITAAYGFAPLAVTDVLGLHAGVRTGAQQ